MSDSDKPTCPAITQGRVAACRGCIFRAGGPSDLCIRLADAYRRKADKLAKAKK